MAPKNLFCIIADPLLQPIIVDQWLFYSFTTILMDTQEGKNINLYDTSIGSSEDCITESSVLGIMADF